MPNWYLKAIPQKVLSVLPGGKKIHEWMQRRITLSLEITDFLLEDRLAHVSRHLAAWNKFGIPDNHPVSLEIGTGWFPLVPLGMALCGAKKVYTVDVNQHTREAAHQMLFKALIKTKQSGELVTFLPNIQPEKWRTFEQLLSKQVTASHLYEHLNVVFLKGILGGLPALPEPIDLIHSNNTFEHIPAEQIPSLLAAIRHTLAPDGISSHYIDLTDHYSYFDSNLSPLNYLRFSESRWNLIENSFQSQNRLRVNQWLDLMDQAKLPVLWQDNESGIHDDLKNLRPAAPFDQMDEQDLLVRYTHLVSRREA